MSVVQLAFDDDVFGGPLLVKGGEAAVLTDAHDVLPEVKVLGVKAQQAEPQLPDRLRVLPVMRPPAGLHRGSVNMTHLINSNLRSFCFLYFF